MHKRLLTIALHIHLCALLSKTYGNYYDYDELSYAEPQGTC